MRTILIFNIIILNSFYVFSQESPFSIGLLGGMTYSNIKVKNPLPGNYDFITGYGIMIDLKRDFGTHISIRTDLAYYQNGYNHNARELIITPNYAPLNSYIGFENIIKLSYLNNSWLLGYNLGDKFMINFNAGFYWAVYLKSNEKTTTFTDIDPTETDYIGSGSESGYAGTTNTENERSDAISKCDFGLVGGISLGYNFNSRYQLILTSRYYRGLVDIVKNEGYWDAESANISFYAGMGIQVKL